MSGDTQANREHDREKPHTHANKQLTRARGITLPTARRGRREQEKTGRGKSKQAPAAQPRLPAIRGTHHTLPHHLTLIVVNLHQVTQHPIHVRNVNDTPLSVAHT